MSFTTDAPGVCLARTRDRARRRGWRAAGLLAASLALSLPVGGAQAADLPPVAPAPAVVAAPPASAWQVQATLYGWATAIDGDVGVGRLPSVPVDATIPDVLKKLDGAVMGSLFARNDQWMLLADLVLARLSHDGHVGTFGGSALDAELSQAIVTGAVGYWLPLGLSNVDIAVTGGLRYMRVSGDLSLTPDVLPLALSGSQSKWWLDPTVGLTVQWHIDERWFMNAIADIGGFGVGSKLSSSGYVGLGYMWTPSLSTAVGYRYLYEDYESTNGQGGTFRYNTTMHGPTVSVAWHF